MKMNGGEREYNTQNIYH